MKSREEILAAKEAKARMESHMKAEPLNDRELYVTCLDPACKSTYPLSQFSKESKSIKCKGCNGFLIDENGVACFTRRMSMTRAFHIAEVEQMRERELFDMQEQMRLLQMNIEDLKAQGF